MNSRTVIGIALAAVGVVGPALVIGVVFGFDETVSRGEGATTEIVALVLALLAGFLTGLLSNRLTRNECDSRWPQLETLGLFFGRDDNDDHHDTSRPSTLAA